MEATSSSMEVWVLGWSVALLVVQIIAQGTAGRDRGTDYLVGPRDEQKSSTNPVAGRLDRALRNFLETYPAFIALVVAPALTGKTGGIGATGALTWIVARTAYVPAYAVGISTLRSLIWFVSIIGLAMMFARLMF